MNHKIGHRQHASELTVSMTEGNQELDRRNERSYALITYRISAT